MRLANMMRNYKQLVIGGIEGSGKSREVLKNILTSDLVDFEKEYVIYATNSYKSLKEKQNELMKYYNLSVNEVPIVAVSDVQESNEQYIDYHGYFPETKIVLMAIQALKRCTHFKLDPIYKDEAKSLHTMIIDEFSFMNTIIPSLDHIANANTLSKSKNSTLNFIKEHYSPYDVMNYKQELKAGNADCFHLAYYLQKARMNHVNVIFITSEILPRLILTELGYSEYEMESPERFKEHTIHYHSDVVNRFTFNRLNDAYKWPIFGFKKIISDKYNPNLKLEKDYETIEVTSHVSAKGSNGFESSPEELLSIISEIPECVIRALRDAINFWRDENDEKVDLKYVKALHYRDVLFQAVGRVIGFRGHKENNQTYVLISEIIMNEILKHINNGSEGFSMPYNVQKWDFDIPEWVEIVEAVKADKRIVNDNRRSNYKETYNEVKQEQLKYCNSILDEYYVKDKDSWVVVNEMKLFLKDMGVTKVVGTYLCNYFGLEQSQKKVEGKNLWVIKGLRKK